ncbi:MAG TPA: hypothetical protein VFG04_27280 [Planctomycetaceae bacterium]|jgi:hypothetical protein|nr:hypothetical protein [Planctomycetaceae bacterium]
METGSSKFPKLNARIIPDKTYAEIDLRLGPLSASAAEIALEKGYWSGDPVDDAETGVLAVKNGVIPSKARSLQSVLNLKAFVKLREEIDSAFFDHLATLKSEKGQLVADDIELAYVLSRFGLNERDSAIARFTPEARVRFARHLCEIARHLMRAIDTGEAVQSGDVDEAYWHVLSRRWGKAMHRGWALTGFIAVKAVGALLLAGIGGLLLPEHKVDLMIAGGCVYALAEFSEKRTGLWERRR